MKKHFALAIVVLSALSLLQCQYAKKVIDDLNTLPSVSSTEENEKSSSSYKTEKSSSSEAKKTRKEVN